MEAFRECPHACITLSEAGTWGSAEQDWSEAGGTEEPVSDDSIVEYSGEGEEPSFEIDHDWAVQGGTTDSEQLPEDSHEVVDDTGQNGEPTSTETHEITGDADADVDELEDLIPKRRRRRRRRKGNNMHHRDIASAVTEASHGHLDPLGKEMLQKLGALEPGKRIIPTQQVSKCEGAELENWTLAAEVEMQSNFINMHAVHESTDAERAAHGRPLPMLCVDSG